MSTLSHRKVRKSGSEGAKQDQSYYDPKACRDKQVLKSPKHQKIVRKNV